MKKKIALWFYTNENGIEIRKQIVDKLIQRGYEVIYDFDMRKCYVLNGHVYTEDHYDLSSVDLFYHMNAEERDAHQRDILQALGQSNVYIFNSVESYLLADDKFMANTALREAGVRVPDSLFLPIECSEDYVKQIFDEWGAFVFKPRGKLCAKGIMKFDQFEKFYDFCLFAKDYVSNLYIEKYIPFEDRDIRVEVFNDKVIGDGFCRVKGHSFKTNVRSGGRAVFVEAEEDAKALALQATNALGITTSIVDMVRNSEDNLPYVLEVNPFLGVFYGAYYDSIGEPIPEYFEKMDRIKIDFIIEHISGLVENDL
ncbi:ATP-grasp domain-containing protein [Cysteiniphilum halobium]|uniref:ATP-grasp domain-containing protein n=1 Tax=Cysteiniphilum halobium TaxID=2219059 RepID=UPI003F84F759